MEIDIVATHSSTFSIPLTFPFLPRSFHAYIPSVSLPLSFPLSFPLTLPFLFPFFPLPFPFPFPVPSFFLFPHRSLSTFPFSLLLLSLLRALDPRQIAAEIAGSVAVFLAILVSLRQAILADG